MVMFPTWGAFTQTLRDHFVLRGITETSVENMRNLEMGSSTCEEYSVLFKGYTLQSGYNEVALIEEYKWGLNKKLREKMYGLVPMPTDLGGWITQSNTLDKQYRIGCAYTAAQTQPSSSRSKPAEKRWTPIPQSTPLPQSHRAPARDPNAMDVDRVHTTGCYNCGKEGHCQAECPAERKKICAYCKKEGHFIAQCTAPGKRPFVPHTHAINIDNPEPAPLMTRANDINIAALSETEIQKLKEKLKDF